MKSKLLFACFPKVGITGCLKMKRLFPTAAVALTFAFCASGLQAQDMAFPGGANASLSSTIIVNQNNESKTIYLPVWNIDVDYFITLQDLQELLQIGYNGWVDTSAPLNSSASFKSSASKAPMIPVCKSNTGNCQVVAPETVVPVKGKVTDAYYEVAINPALFQKFTKSSLKASVAPNQTDVAAIMDQPVLKAPMPPSTQIVYTTPKYQWVNLSSGDFTPKHFEWNGLLTDNKLSLSRENFTAYIGSAPNIDPVTSNLTYYDWTMDVSGNQFIMFAPADISFDYSVPGKETFTTVFTYPVTDAMIVYMPDYVGADGITHTADWTKLNLSYPTQTQLPDLSDYPYYLCDAGEVAKVITNATADAEMAKDASLTTPSWYPTLLPASRIFMPAAL